MTFDGKKLKAIREASNTGMVSQFLRDIYIRTGIKTSRQTLNKWETNRCSPTLANLVGLSTFFGVDMGYFMSDPKDQGK